MISRNATAHYRPEIDGLRAVAVIMALFFHAGVGAFSGGFVGADVFYVISGYLISGIVLREKAAGTFTFVGFYERRVRRIMPALLTMFTATALFALILLPADMVTYAKSLVSAVAFASNFYFWRSLGYFGIEPQYAPLLNTWSLAVEEQLYIVWPFVVVAVSARLSKRGIATFILAVAAAAAAFGLLVIDRIPYGGFFSPVIRSAEFLLGAFLAVDVLPRLKSRWINEALAAAGLLLILSNLPRVHATPFFPRIEVLTACIGTALFIYSAGARDSFVTRLMAARPMVVMGQASYSLYLWHWPILAFGTYYILNESVVHGAKIALAFAAIPVAFLSWRYVEQPFRGRKSRFSRRAMFLGAAGVSAALALYGGMVIALHGLPGRFDDVTQRIVADDVKVHNPCNAQSARSVAKGELCKFGDPRAPARIVVSGDSFSDMYFEALDGLARRYGVSGYLFSAAACRSYVLRPLEPADSKCVARNAEIRKLIRTMRPKAVVLIQRWSLADTAQKAKANNDPRGARWLADLDSGLGDMARFARDAGATLYIVRDVADADTSVTPALAKAHILGLGAGSGHSPDDLRLGLTRTEFERRETIPNATFTALSRRYPVRFLDPGALLCDARLCRVERDGMPLYRDNHHLNRAGAVFVMPAFEPLMRDVAGR